MSQALTITKLQDGHQNSTILVKGVLEKDLELSELLSIHSLNKKPDGVQLQSVIWLIEEKMGIRLWWGENGDLILPMESRNSLRFDVGLDSPKDPSWDRSIWISTFNFTGTLKCFTLVLDFNKQRLKE